MKKLLLSFVAFSCLVAQDAAPVDAQAAAPEAAAVASKGKVKKARKAKAFKGSKKHKHAVMCSAKDEATAKANAASMSNASTSACEGPNGWAMSLVGGAVFSNSEVKNETTGFDLKYKNTYQRLGLGVHYYKTLSNNVMWALGLDVLAGFGGKTVNARLVKDVVFGVNDVRPTSFAARYKQTRPVSAILSGKLGYSYGCVTPYVVLGLRETYVRHKIEIPGVQSKVEKDVAFAVAPGAGVMVKSGNYGFGVEYTYNMESNFGLDGYAEKVKHKSHAVSARVSYFF